MGCCIRNCYGIELEDIKLRVKFKIPQLLLDFLLDLSKLIVPLIALRIIFDFIRGNIFGK